MGLIKQLAEAGRKTHEDAIFLSGMFEKEIGKSTYYDGKSLKFQETLMVLETPIQYISRLCGRDYWRMDKISKTTGSGSTTIVLV
jgi:hypothetical protein